MDSGSTPVDTGSSADADASADSGTDADASTDSGTDADASTDSGTDASADSGADADASVDAAPACSSGAKQCSGNTPQLCVGGTWQNQTACGGATPVCTAGVCGGYTVSGGVRSTAARAGTGTISLAAGGFEFQHKVCNGAGLCVSGGIVP
jgi:hypothetical protein